MHMYMYIYTNSTIKKFPNAISTLMFAQTQWNQQSQRPHCTQSLYWVPQLSASHILKIRPKIIFNKAAA